MFGNVLAAQASTYALKFVKKNLVWDTTFSFMLTY